MSRFILMLTKDDLTVQDAIAVYARLKSSAIRSVGFKDIGLPFEELAELARRIKADGREVVLEVVSSTADSELRSVEAAAKLGVDYVLGGRHAVEAVKLLKGTGIRYFPFAGQTVGHPTRLTGTMEEIVGDAMRLASTTGVDGLDLLAYRFDGDVPELTRRVVAAVKVPVIAAGSIDRRSRIDAMRESGAWGFTIGSALFDGLYPTDPLRAQVDAILDFEGVEA